MNIEIEKVDTSYSRWILGKILRTKTAFLLCPSENNSKDFQESELSVCCTKIWNFILKVAGSFLSLKRAKNLTPQNKQTNKLN